jgi:hypothetical protein
VYSISTSYHIIRLKMSLSLLAAYDDLIRCSTVLAESSCEPGK